MVDCHLMFTLQILFLSSMPHHHNAIFSSLIEHGKAMTSKQKLVCIHVYMYTCMHVYMCSNKSLATNVNQEF